MRACGKDGCPCKILLLIVEGSVLMADVGSRQRPCPACLMGWLRISSGAVMAHGWFGSLSCTGAGAARPRVRPARWPASDRSARGSWRRPYRSGGRLEGRRGFSRGNQECVLHKGTAGFLVLPTYYGNPAASSAHWKGDTDRCPCGWHKAN